jgi:thioredoxin-related protein
MRKLASLLLGFSFAFLTIPLFSQSPQFSSPSSQQHVITNPAVSNQINWLKDFSEGIRQSQATGKPILILFTGTSWCPACIKLEREVLKKPELAHALSDQFIFVKAEFPRYSEEEIQRSPYKGLLDRYQINSFPTMVIVNSNGEKLTTLPYKPTGPTFYIQQLREFLNHYAQQRQTSRF